MSTHTPSTMPCQCKTLFEGETPLSPFARTPWTSIITLAMWCLLGLTGRTEDRAATLGEQVWATSLALITYAFYLYKIAENIVIVMWPHRWWTIAYLSSRRRAKLFASGKIMKAGDLFDAVDLLFVAAFCANGLMLAALVEWLPPAFPVLVHEPSQWARLIRLSTTIAFAGFGTGFTGVQPSGVVGEPSAWLLSSVQVFVASFIVSSLVSVVSSSREKTARQS